MRLSCVAKEAILVLRYFAATARAGIPEWSIICPLQVRPRDSPTGNKPTNESAPEATPRGHRGIHCKKRRRTTVVEKSVLALPTPRRVRDRDHVKSVAKQPCLVCGRRPADAHHLRFAQSSALGRKVSDEFTVPLCRGHHREVHRSGDEAAWWVKFGIDPTISARVLWLKTHPVPAFVHALRLDPSLIH
jgi:hypothetical protein